MEKAKTVVLYIIGGACLVVMIAFLALAFLNRDKEPEKVENTDKTEIEQAIDSTKQPEEVEQYVPEEVLGDGSLEFVDTSGIDTTVKFDSSIVKYTDESGISIQFGVNKNTSSLIFNPVISQSGRENDQYILYVDESNGFLNLGSILYTPDQDEYNNIKVGTGRMINAGIYETEYSELDAGMTWSVDEGADRQNEHVDFMVYNNTTKEFIGVFRVTIEYDEYTNTFSFDKIENRRLNSGDEYNTVIDILNNYRDTNGYIVSDSYEVDLARTFVAEVDDIAIGTLSKPTNYSEEIGVYDVDDSRKPLKVLIVQYKDITNYSSVLYIDNDNIVLGFMYVEMFNFDEEFGEPEIDDFEDTTEIIEDIEELEGENTEITEEPEIIEEELIINDIGNGGNEDE